MRKKKRVVVSGAILGIVLIIGIGFVACHKPPMFCGGGIHGTNFPSHVLEKMDGHVEELGLTSAQQEAYMAIRTHVEAELADMGKNREALFQAVKTEMDHVSPDMNVLADLLKDHSKRFPERVTFFVDQFMAFYGVLDGTQKEKVATELKDKFKKFEAFKNLVCD